MSDKRPERQEPETEEERLKRPDDEIKDLDAPSEEAEDVRGGFKYDGPFK